MSRASLWEATRTIAVMIPGSVLAVGSFLVGLLATMTGLVLDTVNRRSRELDVLAHRSPALSKAGSFARESRNANLARRMRR